MAKYCEKLTKQMLKDWGFTQVVYQPDINPECTDSKDKWYIERKWRKNSTNIIQLKRISVTEAVCKHKFTDDKKYLKITFMTEHGPKSITLARFIYVWFNGDLEEGEVVDHIDNDPYNNYPTNLQKLSVGQNLAKRWVDNPNCNKNQYTTALYKLVNEMCKAGKTYDECLAKIYKYIEERE